MIAGAALAVFLSAQQVMRINYVLQEAPNGVAIRAAAIFLVESSGGADRKRRDKTSFGWFQLQRKTACLMESYSGQSLRACPITARKLETDTALNTRLGLAYIEYCNAAFPASEARAIACHRWGVPKTKAMTPAKLKRLESKGGYVYRVLYWVRRLHEIKVDTR